MKKLKTFLIAIFIIICIIIVNRILFYKHIDAIYTVEPKISQYKEAILQRINNPTTVTNQIQFKNELSLDNKKYFIIAFDNREGYSELTKGTNGKYKMGESCYSDNSLFNCIIKETNKGKYIILFCKNKIDIQYAIVQLDGHKYKIDVPQSEYVIAYCKVSNSTQVGIIDINDIKFYNKNEKDITQDAIYNFTLQ